MRTSYDREADAMFVWFGPEGVKSTKTEEAAPGVMLDFDENGEVIGVEILWWAGDFQQPNRPFPVHAV
jgi:uncharacterized protein YuzE